MQCIFAGKFEVINIINNTVLEDIKACLWSKDRQVILKFANKENKSKKGSGIDRENNGNKEDNSKEGSKIDGENNKDKDN